MEDKNNVKTIKLKVVRLDEAKDDGEARGVFQDDKKKTAPIKKRIIIKPDEPVYTLPVMPPDYDKRLRGKPVEK